MLAGWDAEWIAKGMEDRLNGDVKFVTGREPVGLREWVEGRRGIWV